MENIDFTVVQVLKQSLYALQATVLYQEKVKEWKNKPIAHKTWETFKEFFADAYYQLCEEQTMNSKQGGF